MDSRQYPCYFIKWLHDISFLATFQNFNREYFAWIQSLLKLDILDLNLQKRMFSIIFSKFENIFSFQGNFKKVLLWKFNAVTGCRLQSCNFIIKEPRFKFFLILSKVLGADISKCLHKNICDGVHCVGIRKRFANPKKELNVLYTARQEELLTQHQIQSVLIAGLSGKKRPSNVRLNVRTFLLIVDFVV